MTERIPHLARLGAQARPTASAAAGEARQYCADVLTRRGFSVKEQEFEYSQFPGRWATPTAGFVIPAVATGIVALRAAVSWWLPAAIAAVLVVVALVVWVARGGVLGLSLARARGVNLEARRALPDGGDEPAVWLVAHIDSKWQPVSMLVRVAGVILVAISAIGLALALTAWTSTIADFLALLWLGGIPLMLSVVGARNHGTLDNASGVAAVLEAIELLPETANVGVLISDAEELALAGASAWAVGRRAGTALNCDSVDDEGELVVMYTGVVPRQLLSSFEQAASDSNEPLRTLRLLPGILTDSVALARAGWNTVTLSRGTLRTLSRIHTSRDSLATMDGRGIAGAARVLVRVAMEMS
ncbi:MAG TPA: M28 family peptidase [Gemmatimonadaceae bacterium]